MIAQFPVKAKECSALWDRAHVIATRIINEGKDSEGRRRAPGVRYSLQQATPAEPEKVTWNDGDPQFGMWGCIFEARWAGDEYEQRGPTGVGPMQPAQVRRTDELRNR